MSNPVSTQSLPPVVEANRDFEEISQVTKIIGTSLGVGIRMTANFCLSYSMHYAMESIAATAQKVGSLVNNGISFVLFREINEIPFDHAAYEEMILKQQVRRLNYSMLAAISVPIQPAVRYCFQKLLDCKPETPWRNSAAMIASSFTSVVLSATACNQLGYEIDTSMMLYNQAVALCLVPAVITLMKGIDYLTDQLEEIIDSPEQEETLIEESYNLDPARLRVMDPTVVAKAEVIKQQLLAPLASAA